MLVVLKWWVDGCATSCPFMTDNDRLNEEESTFACHIWCSGNNENDKEVDLCVMMVTAATAATASGGGGGDFLSDKSIATYLFIWSR